MCRGDTLGDDGLDDVGTAHENVRKHILFALAEVLKNEVSCVLATGRATNAHANSNEVRGSYGGNDVTKTVVPTMTATNFDANVIERDVEFVVNHDQVRGRNREELEQGRRWLAREVHECAWLSQNQLCSAGRDASLGDERIGLMRAKARPDIGSELCVDHLANVVTMAGVAGPGVTEPDYKPRVSVQELLHDLLSLGSSARELSVGKSSGLLSVVLSSVQLVLVLVVSSLVSELCSELLCRLTGVLAAS